MRIFTKRFFQLDSYDQAAVLNAAIHERKDCIGRHGNPRDDRKAERSIEYLRRRGTELGVLVDDPC
jgi:hypothetical protein